MLDINKIRKDFPILERRVNGYPLVYLDSAATSQKPKQVLEVMDDYYRRHNANVHRGVHTLSVEASELMDEARRKIAKFIGGRFEEIIFVRNATEAINLVAYSWGEQNIHQGDAVVISLMEHHSNLVPWQRLCQRKGAELRVIEVDDQGNLDRQSLESLLDDKVKLVAVTWVSNVLGTINPITDLRSLILDKVPKAKILIDACQAVPHRPVNVEKLKVDWLVFSGHKMMASTGTGVLWGRKELLEEMEPFLFGGDMISEVTIEKSTWSELPYKFEAGTPDIAGAIALGAAVDYLEGLGMEQVAKHEHDLISYALEQMQKLGEIEIYGPLDPGKRAGVLTFNVKGVHAHDTATILDNLGIAIRSGQHCGAPIVNRFKVPAMARASFYVYNTREEIDTLIEKLAEVKKVFN